MSDKQLLVLTIGEAGGLSPERVDELLLGLTEELRLLPQIEVERGKGAPPGPGEKAVEGSIAAELFVQIAGGAVTFALPTLVDTVRAWIGRQSLTSQPITISCNGMSMEIAAGTPTADVTRLVAEASKGATG